MSLFEERVEAGARVLRERLFPGVDLPLGDSAWVAHAREVLRAADAVCCAHPKCPGGSLCCCQSDAVVTEEMIAETILKALVFTNENSKPWADGLARDIASLFRGGAK